MTRGASLGGGVTIPLWVDVGLFAASTIFFSIWMVCRVTVWRLGKPMHDKTAHSMLFWALSVQFLNLVASLATVLGHLFWERQPDGVWVTVSFLSLWTISYAILGKMLAVFLCANSVWIESLFWTFAGAVGSLIVCTTIGYSTRYLWFACHVLVFVWSIHASWVYRRRSDFHALFILIVISILFIVGLTIPYLLGVSALYITSFTVEVWWYSIFMWLGQFLVPWYLCANLYKHGEELTGYINKRAIKIFTTRTDGVGEPGDELFPEFRFLPTSEDKRAQNEALETGRGQRHPTSVLGVRHTHADAVEFAEQVDEYGLIKAALSDPAPDGSGRSAVGKPHLLNVGKQKQ